jgi:hypothetical protein
MHRLFLVRHSLLSMTVLLLCGIMSPVASGASPASSPAAGAGTTPHSALAAGASEDSLKTCLDRIPKDATVGQRLIAEQSCWRDEGNRKPFEATSGR